MVTVVFYISLTATVVSGLLFVYEQVAMDVPVAVTEPFVSGMLLSSGLLLVVGQGLYTLATKYEDVSKLALMFYF